MTTLFASIGIFVLFVPLLAALAILRGYVLATLWAWFVVPTFGLPVLGIAAAIGIALTASFMAKDHPPPKKEDEDKWRAAKAMVFAFLSPLLALLMGWIVQHWM